MKSVTLNKIDKLESKFPNVTSLIWPNQVERQQRTAVCQIWTLIFYTFQNHLEKLRKNICSKEVYHIQTHEAWKFNRKRNGFCRFISLKTNFNNINKFDFLKKEMIWYVISMHIENILM